MTRRRTPKGGSSLADRLKDLDVSGLAGPNTVPVSVVGTEEPSNQAFCPILVEYADKGECGLVDCIRCEFLYEEYEQDETAWLCSRCAGRNARAEPYWGDGHCEWCGKQSSVLILCLVL